MRLHRVATVEQADVGGQIFAEIGHPARQAEIEHLAANYAIRKLTQAGLVQPGRKGKEKTVSVTENGAALCARYGEVREKLLVQSARQSGHDPAELSRLAALLRTLSGSYDQAARSAAAL